MKKNMSARVMPRNPDNASSSQSFMGLSGKNGIFKIIMVKAIKTAATKLLYMFKEIGEKTFPHFLNMITAHAQKKAELMAKIEPSISCPL
jgi:hypothetical protein